MFVILLFLGIGAIGLKAEYSPPDAISKVHNFYIPSINCPTEFSVGLLVALNAERAKHGWPPMELDQQLTERAQEWALTNRYMGDYEKNSKYGQKVYVQWMSSHKEKFWYSARQVIDQWQGYPGPLVWYGNRLNYFTTEENIKTKKIGIGCSTYWEMPPKKGAGTWVTVFFEYNHKEKQTTALVPTRPPTIKPPPTYYNCHPKKNWTFSVPSVNCSTAFMQEFLCSVNAERVKNGWAPLELSADLNEKALAWSLTNDIYHTAKPNEPNYGQLYFPIWGSKGLHEYKFRMQTLYEYWSGPNLRPEIWTGGKVRRYSVDDWVRTTQIGIGCSANWVLPPYEKGSVITFSVFFDYNPQTTTPKPTTPKLTTTTAKPTTPQSCIPTPKPNSTKYDCKARPDLKPHHFPTQTHGCPSGFAEEMLCLFNKHQSTKGLSPLTLSPETSIEAQKWANTDIPKGDFKPDLKHFSQNIWSIYFYQNLTDIPIGAWQPLDAWNGNGNLSIYTGNGIFEQQTEADWKRVKNLGIGCSTAQLPKYGTQVFVVVFSDLRPNCL